MSFKKKILRMLLINFRSQMIQTIKIYKKYFTLFEFKKRYAAWRKVQNVNTFSIKNLLNLFFN